MSKTKHDYCFIRGKGIQISLNNVILYYLKDKHIVIVDMKANIVK